MCRCRGQPVCLTWAASSVFLPHRLHLRRFPILSPPQLEYPPPIIHCTVLPDGPWYRDRRHRSCTDCHDLSDQIAGSLLCQCSELADTDARSQHWKYCCMRVDYEAVFAICPCKDYRKRSPPDLTAQDYGFRVPSLVI